MGCKEPAPSEHEKIIYPETLPDTILCPLWSLKCASNGIDSESNNQFNGFVAATQQNLNTRLKCDLPYKPHWFNDKLEHSLNQKLLRKSVGCFDVDRVLNDENDFVCMQQNDYFPF